MARSTDLTGQRFGRLVVVGLTPKAPGRTRWECQCDCGGRSSVETYKLRHGRTASCGCGVRDAVSQAKRTHGFTDHPLFRTWRHMRRRCGTPTAHNYHNYGGRGIRVCAEWEASAETFITWALANGWAPQLTIDRIDPNGPYTPANCRFIHAADQPRNRRPGRLPLGVREVRKRYQAVIRGQHLGTYDTPELAHRVYLDSFAVFEYEKGIS